MKEYCQNSFFQEVECMYKIPMATLIAILKTDVTTQDTCVELNFCIDNDLEYVDCWLGKMPDKIAKDKEVYWYGLVPDGSQAYDYEQLDDFLEAKVFRGKNIYEVFDTITLFSLNGSSIEEMLPYFDIQSN
jgi:hypothetical protein